MGQITFILGDVRSWKSSQALKLVEASGKSVTLIVIAQAFKDEISVRIQKHRSERPAQ